MPFVANPVRRPPLRPFIDHPLALALIALVAAVVLKVLHPALPDGWGT